MNARTHTQGLNLGAFSEAMTFAALPAGLVLPGLWGLKFEVFFLPPVLDVFLTAAEEFDLANAVPPCFVYLVRAALKKRHTSLL